MFKISLLAARNERESAQIALRPKVSWGSSGIAGAVQIHCTDLCSSSGDRLGFPPPFPLYTVGTLHVCLFGFLLADIISILVVAG